MENDIQLKNNVANEISAQSAQYPLDGYLLRAENDSANCDDARTPIQSHNPRAFVAMLPAIQGQTFDNHGSYLVSHVKGLSAEQAESILRASFRMGAMAVVVGGSRVRGNAHALSDLDVGFEGLTVSQANRLIKKLNRDKKAGWIQLEETKIVPGNATHHIPRIESPQEFFNRSGVRTHGSRKGEHFSPSGSITCRSDGSIHHIRHDGTVYRILASTHCRAIKIAA